MAGRDDSYLKLTGYMRLAKSALYGGRAQDARTFLNQAIGAFPEGDPGRTGAWLESASLRLETGDAADALEDARQAKQDGARTAGHWWGIYLSALALARLDRWDEAEQAAEQIRGLIDTIPSERWRRSYGHLAGVFSLLRDDAPGAIEKLTAAEPLLAARAAPHLLDTDEHVPLWFSLASAHLANGDEDEAARWFQRISDCTTEHINWPVQYVRSFYFLGKIHEERGEMDKAREYYQRFLDFWGEGDLDRERVAEARSKL